MRCLRIQLEQSPSIGRTDKLPNSGTRLAGSEQQVLFFDFADFRWFNAAAFITIVGWQTTLSVTHFLGREPPAESGRGAPPCCTLRQCVCVGRFLGGASPRHLLLPRESWRRFAAKSAEEAFCSVLLVSHAHRDTFT